MGLEFGDRCRMAADGRLHAILIKGGKASMAEHSKGFKIVRDSENVVTVRAWGVWKREVGQQFAQAFQETIRKFQNHDAGWYLLLDFFECPAQSQEIEEILTEAVLLAKQHGMRQKAILARWSTIPLLSEKLAQYPDLPVHFYFQSEKDAVRWLIEE